MSSQRIGLFGEVLFDHFPDGSRVPGGAPLNVAWHLQAFGAAPLLISRLGSDADAQNMRSLIGHWQLDPSGLQQDPQRPTGWVRVTLKDGEPSYQIVEDVAWDAISTLHLPALGWLYHGSLALRSAASTRAFDAMRLALQGAGTRLYFDVNLRPPWYQPQQVLARLLHADWAKLNAAEFRELYGASDPLDTATLEAARKDWQLSGLIVTQGAQGAVVVTADETLQARPVAIDAAATVDTVGAGDAFSSVFLLGLASQWPLAVTLRRALDFAAQIVTRRGATVDDPAFYRAVLSSWQTP